MAEAGQRVVALALDDDDEEKKPHGAPESLAASPSLAHYVMDAAYRRVAADGTEGSSTATLAVLDGANASLSIMSLGDSRIVVLRGDDVLYKSDRQEHEFGRPYQTKFSLLRLFARLRE
jgi:hypothetical protein